MAWIARLRPLLLLLIFLLPTQVVFSAPDGWNTIAPGIEYQEYHLTDPNNVFVARMERAVINVTLESSIAQGRLSGGLETVSGMASRYNQTINYWNQTWGGRNQVVVAINGSFFDPATGIPQRGVIHSGWYAKRFTDLEDGSGFVWKLDGSAFIGQCVLHRPDKQILLYPRSGNYQYFNGINVPRAEDELIVYTPQYDANTPTEDDNQVVEVLVEMSQPAMIVPRPGMVSGYVRAIRDRKGATNIPFDHIVLSAHGSKRNFLLNNVELGDEVGISQAIKHYDDDCNTLLDISWEQAYASVGGSFNFLKDGEIQDFDDPGATQRHPRTAIVFNNEYIYFIVVDGRNPLHSIGMTIHELALFARDSLGTTWGIAQDGGGSSTMVINGAVVNNTFCNNVFCRGYSFLPLIAQTQPLLDSDNQQSKEALPNIPHQQLERLVANGMMMVVVKPVEKSSLFSAGDLVVTQAVAEVRLGPGTNYAVLASLPSGTSGVILAHFNHLEGVKATGAYWWKISAGGLEGWVKESALQPAPQVSK